MNDLRPCVVYVVDDDEDVRDSIRALLLTFGFQIEVFSSPLTLLSKLPDEAVGCLLLDQNMPGMTGLDLLGRLRAQGIQTPAVLLTANGDKLEAQRLAADALAILRKPVAEDELVKWVGRACAMSRTA